MGEQKTRKVLEISDGSYQYVCIKTSDKYNPYRLYRVWWDAGYHRKLIEKYADMGSVLMRIWQSEKERSYWNGHGYDTDETNRIIYGWR